MDQPWGERAKQFTEEVVLGEVVTVEVKDRDQYDRTVGVVILPDGADLNAMLVGEGLAWWYRRHARDAKELERLEAEARMMGTGLWSEADPVPPWQWRRQ